MEEPDLAALREAIAGEGFAQLLGIELLALEPGHAKVAMVVRQDMLNFLDLPHGGAIFALADTAFGAASNSRGARAVALNVISPISRQPTPESVYWPKPKKRNWAGGRPSIPFG